MQRRLEHAPKSENRFSPVSRGDHADQEKMHQSFDAAGAGAPGGGSSWIGADALWAAGVRLGAAASFFLAAATAEPAAGAGGRGEGDADGAFATGAEVGGRGAGDAAGSGVMMLTGGVEAAEGKSA